MKKADVVMGGRYKVRVSGVIANVRLVSESCRGGWYGVNEATGRQVRIKTAARLRRPAGGVYVIKANGRYLTDEPRWVEGQGLAKSFTNREDARDFFLSLSGTEMCDQARLVELAK